MNYLWRDREAIDHSLGVVLGWIHIRMLVSSKVDVVVDGVKSKLMEFSEPPFLPSCR